MTAGVAWVAPASAATPATWHATEVSPPSAAGYSVLDTVSCTGAGSCAAGGIYGVAAPQIGSDQAMVATESNGTWQTAQEIALPSDAATSTQSARVTSIARTAPGACTAVGSYFVGDNAVPLIATESRGS